MKMFKNRSSLSVHATMAVGLVSVAAVALCSAMGVCSSSQVSSGHGCAWVWVIKKKRISVVERESREEREGEVER